MKMRMTKMPKGTLPVIFRLEGLVLRTKVDSVEEGVIEERDPDSRVLITPSSSTTSFLRGGAQGASGVVCRVLADSKEGVEFAFFDRTFSPSGLNSWGIKHMVMLIKSVSIEV